MEEQFQPSWPLIVGYLALMLGVGAWGRRRVRSIEDMAVAGRRAGPWLIAFSVAATWINGTTLIGITAIGKDVGLSSYWVGGSFVITTLWIGAYLVPRLWATRIITIPELFERFFGPTHRITALCLVILRDLGVTAGTIGAFAIVTGALLQTSLVESLALMAGVTLIYVFMGGMWAVLVTDAIQFLLIVVGSVGLLIAGFARVGGVGGLRAGADPIVFDLFSRADVSQVAGWIAIGVSVTCGYQGIIQRGFAASSPSVARRGFLYGGVLASLWYIVPPLLGIVSEVIYGTEIASEDAFVAMAFGASGTKFGSLIVISVLAASMSTLSSTINTMASNLTIDLYTRFLRPRASVAHQLLVYRANVIVVGLLAAAIYYAVPLIIELFWIGGRIMGASVAPALVALVLFPAARRAPRTILTAMLSGGGILILWQLFGTIQEVGSVIVTWELDPILVGLPFAVAVLVIGVPLEARGRLATP